MRILLVIHGLNHLLRSFEISKIVHLPELPAGPKFRCPCGCEPMSTGRRVVVWLYTCTHDWGTNHITSPPKQENSIIIIVLRIKGLLSIFCFLLFLLAFLFVDLGRAQRASCGSGGFGGGLPCMLTLHARQCPCNAGACICMRQRPKSPTTQHWGLPGPRG